MNAEFNWWLLIVGLVVGAGLVWYVVFDGRRRESDVGERERAREATWLSAVLDDEGYDVPPEAALRLLELHGRYLEAPPPDDEPAEPDPAPGLTPVPAPVVGSEVAGDDRRGIERGPADVRE